MRKLTGVLKYHWVLIAMACLVSFGAISMEGCAGRTKTTTVTTETTNGGSGSGGTSTVTTQEAVETSAHPRGILGGLFYTIGQVLIFPFKLIGSLFS